MGRFSASSTAACDPPVETEFCDWAGGEASCVRDELTRKVTTNDRHAHMIAREY
jgi:hypothetical protein